MKKINWEPQHSKNKAIVVFESVILYQEHATNIQFRIRFPVSSFRSSSLISIKYFQFKRRFSSDSLYVNLRRYIKIHTYKFFWLPGAPACFINVWHWMKCVESSERCEKSTYLGRKFIGKHKKSYLVISVYSDSAEKGELVERYHKRHESASCSSFATHLNFSKYKINLGWRRSIKWPHKDNNGICGGNQMQRSRIFSFVYTKDLIIWNVAKERHFFWCVQQFFFYKSHFLFLQFCFTRLGLMIFDPF